LFDIWHCERLRLSQTPETQASVPLRTRDGAERACLQAFGLVRGWRRPKMIASDHYGVT